MTLPANQRGTLDSRQNWDARSIGRQSFRSPGIDWDACYVYVAWGHDRTRPLYVGKSREPLARIGRHLRTTAWASDVVEWDLYAFDSEDGALDAESRAIHELNPVHNVIRGGSGGRRTKTFTRRPRRHAMPTALEAVPRPIHGISSEQLAIIAKVQRRRGSVA